MTSRLLALHEAQFLENGGGDKSKSLRLVKRSDLEQLRLMLIQPKKSFKLGLAGRSGRGKQHHQLTRVCDRHYHEICGVHFPLDLPDISRIVQTPLSTSVRLIRPRVIPL